MVCALGKVALRIGELLEREPAAMPKWGRNGSNS